MADLDKLVRKVVGVAHKTTKSLQEDVTHVTWTGQDGFGDPLPPVNVTRLMLVEQKLEKHHMADGRTIEISAKLASLLPILPNGAAGRIEPVDPRDEFILADGSRGKAVAVEGLRKGTPYVSTIYLGVD